RRLRAGDAEGGRNSLNRATEFALALTLPAAVGLVVLALPLISVLFGRGEFGADDVANTALALAIYGLGLPAFVLQKTLQPLYYAREDTRRPFRYAVVSMVVNVVLAVGLMPLIGFAAAALATTASGWFMFLQLWLGTRGMGPEARADARLRSRIWRIMLASGVMGGLLWVFQIVLGPGLGVPGWRYAALGGLIGIGILGYFGTGALIGAFKMSDFRSALRRGN
ncbi:MAG: lipid II flippase MurJ, partial [Gemmobacter sp.]|nr:lipid II flippase MurJ [Gemmobacter sp.]